MATHEQPRGRVHAVELTAVVATHASIEPRVARGLNERRLGVLALVLGVGLAAASLGFTVDGWRGLSSPGWGASCSSSSC